MQQVTTTDTIKYRRASTVPGDDLREMTAPMRDTAGKLWPKGTQYRGLAGGFDQSIGKNVAVINIIRVP